MDILDQEPEEQEKINQKFDKSRKKISNYLAGLIILNIFLQIYLKYPENKTNMGYHISRVATETVLTYLFTLPIIAMIIGLALGLIPYKKVAYYPRFKNMSVWSLTIINLIVTLFFILQLSNHLSR